MSEDTNKDLEQNQTNVTLTDKNSVINNAVPVENVGVVNDNGDVTSNINATGVIEEVSFNYPENEAVQITSSEVGNENTIPVIANAQTVVDEPAPVTASSITIEEVSINADSNSLETTEVSNNSVFNNNNEGVTTGTLKEGQEYRAEKKGFPYGMVIGFIILIICALFINNIVDFVENVILNKDAAVEEKSNNENNKEEQEKNENESDKENDSNNNQEIDNNENDNTNTNINDNVDNDVNLENNDGSTINSDNNINDDLNNDTNSSING